MRLKLLKIFTILLIAGSSDGRPQQIEVSANLQPKIEEHDIEGWRPTQHDANVPQETISVDKDLPQIVEGNSRYTGETRTRRRESKVVNYLFSDDQIPVFSREKTNHRSYEQSDLEAFKFKVFKPSNSQQDIRKKENDEFFLRDSRVSDVKISSSNRNNIEETLNKIVDLNNNVMLNGTAHDERKLANSTIENNDKSSGFIIATTSPNVDSNLRSSISENLGNPVPFIENKKSSSPDEIMTPVTFQRKKINSHYKAQMKLRPVLFKNSSNLVSDLSVNLNTSSLKPRISKNDESQTRTFNLTKVRPRITFHSQPISQSYGYKPVYANHEKVMNFVEIVPATSNLKNSTDQAGFLSSNLDDLHNIHNQVSRAKPYSSQIGVEHSENNSKEIVIAIQRLTNQTSKQKFDSKNSTKALIRIKPQANGMPSHLMIETKNHEISGQDHSKNSLKNNVRFKVDSSQSIPDLNLKNWPNDKLQNIEDLLNYEKYTFFHDGNETLEAQEITNVVASYENSPDIDKVTTKPDKRPAQKPSILIFEHSLPPTDPVKNSETDVITIYEPVSHVDLEQSAQEVVQWEQIPPITSDNSDFLVTDINAESNVFDPIPEGLKPDRPLKTKHDQAESTNYYGYVDESLPGEHPSLQIVQNYDVEPVKGQEYYENPPDQPIFDNPNLEATENNFDPGDVTRPASETNESYGTYTDYQNGPVRIPDLPKQPYFNPMSVVSQNTVVHILNTGKKRPNVTVTEMKLPQNHSGTLLNPKNPPADNKNSSTATPNVHIIFTMPKNEDEEKTGQQIPEVSYDNSIDCPTIMINSYTKVNNTIQGKEGCTDLNIVINSHVLNTNVFKPAITSEGNYGSDNKQPSERYPGSPEIHASYPTSGGGYGTFSADSGQYTGGSIPGEFQDFPITDGQNTQDIPQDSQSDQQSPGTSILEVFQQTQINVGSQNDISSAGDALDQGVPNDPSSPEAGIANAPSSTETGVGGDPPSPSAVPGTGVLNDPASLTEVADDPGTAGIAGDPTAGGEIPPFPPVDGIQDPLADPGPADVAADSGVESVAADTPVSPGTGGSSGIQFPSFGNPLSGITDQLSDFTGNLGSQTGSGGASDSGIGSPGSILGGGDDDDDGDDEDMLDLIPFSIIESVTSMLPYFTLLNPLNYGFLSFAISPLAVVVVGFFGLAAAFVPWAIPSVLNFGRATDRVTIRLRPSLEEVVKRSIRRYEDWNEWKRKRKKRKR